MSAPSLDALVARLAESEAEASRLRGLINTPHTDDFLQAVRLEATHQRERWGSEHDSGKTAPDWYWLLGYLAGKALEAWKRDDRPKLLHHIVTAAAALLNWHAAVTGADTSMRPGIVPPPEVTDGR
jgi:hypothetical protein